MDACQKRLNQDIEIINKNINDSIKNVEAIILCGGYGRGEGAWIKSESTETILPYNDYDIVVVTNAKITSAFVKLLEKEIAKKVGIKWIDIDVITINQLSSLKTTIKNVDLKYASRIIYGNSEILSLIPDLNSEEIGTYDIETLYFTRLWTFMGSLSQSGFTSINIEDARFFKNQMAKAILAVIDVLLIRKKKYVTSYTQRLTNAIEIYPEKKFLLFYGKWALNEKLSPSSEVMRSDEVIRLYSEVHRIYKQEMSAALSSYYLFGFSNFRSLDINYMLMPHYIVRRVYHYIINRSILYEQSLLIRRAQNYLFFAYSDGDINAGLVKKAMEIIEKLDSSVNTDCSWHQARIKIARIRNGE